MKDSKGLHGFSHWQAERISRVVLMALVASSVLLFLAFFAIGYHRPYPDAPTFNAPLLTDVLLVFMLLVVMGAVGIGLWMMGRARKVHVHDEKVVNGIPVVRNAYLLSGSVAALLLLTYLLGSATPIQINGHPFSDGFWLRVADMFVWTTVVLVIVAVAIVGWHYVKMHRKEKV